MNNQWVIPDIHGCLKTLRALIEDLIKPDKTDRIYFLGDYIDRGPDSKGVIDYLMKKKSEGFDFKFLLGNHEESLLKSYENEPLKTGLFVKKNQFKRNWFQYGGDRTVESFGVKNLNDIPQKYIDWLRGLDYCFETKDYIFVHAGLNFQIDNPFEDKHAMLWVRDFDVDAEKINQRTIVHGHVSVNLEFIYHHFKNESYRFIDLDNGVYMKGKDGFGNLLALNLESRELLIQPNID